MDYYQSTGELFEAPLLPIDKPALLGICYSGNLGIYRDAPEYDQVPFKGCIPRGIYLQEVLPDGMPNEDPSKTLAGPVIRLTKLQVDSNRDGFLGHGDNCTHDASDGCIVAAHDVRVAWAAAIAAGDNKLTVQP